MKKIFALFLILAMLVPMSVVAQADEVETKPFYLIQWGNTLDEQAFVHEMPFFWVNDAYLKSGNVLGSVWHGGANSYEIPAIAQALKEEFDTYPDGARYINYCMVQDALGGFAEDIVFVEKGVEISQQWLTAFLTEYKRIGGKLDGLVCDIEFENLYATYIHSRFSKSNPMCYSDIVNNPMYQEKIRPELVARGFKFYDKITPETPEIYSIHPNVSKDYPGASSIWDAVLRSYMNGMVTEACKPLWEFYPEAEMSDYQSKDLDPWLKELNDFGGLNAAGGNFTTAGTSSNENYYSTRPYRFFTDDTGAVKYSQIPGYNSAIYENKTFNYFLFEANIFKNTKLASKNGEVTFWTAHYLYNLSNPNSPSRTPYYCEQLFHMGLLNPQNFMGYIIQSEVGYEEDYYFCLDIVDDVLRELTRMVGQADRKPIDVKTSWNSSFVVSGMTAGGRNVWRLTPDDTLGDLESFKVAGASDLTFKIGNETITFPGGKIVEDGKVRGWDANDNIIENNTFGYWIETAVDVTPIVTREADYHSKYPAFIENYEAYEVGTEYNFKNALPETCWEVKKTGAGSSATVIADPSNADNKVLELKGNFTMKNVRMPKNITAGDSYAEHQAWDVEITIPSDMAAEAELILLNATADNKKSDDGGFKVSGNKVYYSDNGEYKELSGVTLTPGSKYRFVRDMDFNNKDALASSYYVYDASGKLLGSAKNVAMSKIALPIAGVNMSCSGVTGAAVLVDNFKLYPTKVGMDFELYDVKTGIMEKDLETPRAGNTAYRLSWLNSTNKEKTYTVMAAYYNGDKLVEEKAVKEVKMAANFEGLDYGIVEVAEGQTVKVYLRNDNPAEEDDDVPGGAGDVSGGMDITMLIVIAAAAVVVIAAVLVVLLTSKKPAKKGKKGKKKSSKKGAKKASAKKTAKKAPAKENPVEEAPVEEAPVEETEPKKDAE